MLRKVGTNMKKIIALLLTWVVALTSIVVCAENAYEWTCQNCGNECTGNFCANCGNKRNEQLTSTAEVEKSEENVRLDLNIGFEKNAYFSTYDVKLFVDGEWITTMHHGNDFAVSLSVKPGKHAITFEADSMVYIALGGTTINVEEPIRYRCDIQAKMDTIQVTNERTEKVSAEQELANNKHIVDADGNLKLRVNIEFKKNGVFSQYDVDMYCDDIYIATLPHGKNYEGTLLVSKGNHVITFYKSGEKSIHGNCSFKVTKDAYFSCKIEAEKNKVDVKKDKLTQ